MRAGSARAVLLGALACVPLACSSPSERELSGVIVIDTLRSDRLSAYGNERSTSPVFDRLARRGVLFEQAISPSSWTLPSMPVMLGHETAHRVAFSRVHRKGPPTVSVRDGRYKLIRDLSQGAEGATEIYDLAVDPGETRDLAGSSPEIEPSLEQELERFQAELQRRGPLDFSLEQAALPDELRDQLRVLGYLDEEGEGAEVGPGAGDAIPN